jgi:hypothetical protein
MGIGASAAVLGLVVAHAVAILETVQELSVCIYSVTPSAMEKSMPFTAPS